MEPENLTPLPAEPSAGADTAELQARCDSLQHLVGSVLLLLLMVSGTLFAFIYWQVRTIDRELQTIRPQVATIVANYQQHAEKIQNEFRDNLIKFGRTHPDFTPILARYNLWTNLPSGPGPGSAPAKKP
jgi:hypothetical protein